MGHAVRLFLVHDDDSVERFALSRFERLYGRRDPKERLPEHAGKRLRYARFPNCQHPVRHDAPGVY